MSEILVGNLTQTAASRILTPMPTMFHALVTIPDPAEQPTVDLETARTVLGFGRSSAYYAVKNGTWPMPVIRVGAKIRIPTVTLSVSSDYSTRPRPTD